MAATQFHDIAGQHGLATHAQLLERGWTVAALRHARATRWQQPMPRVLAPHRGQLAPAAWLVALRLWAGPRSLVTGHVALNHLGVPTEGLSGATLVIPDTARARRHGSVRTVRSLRPVGVGGTVGVADLVRAPRALVDAAVHEGLSHRDLEHLAITVLQRGLGTPEEFERELWFRPAAKVAPVWRGLEAFVGGAWSRPEAALRAIIDADGGFPPLLTNVDLVSTVDGSFVGTPDGWLEVAGIAIQVQSRQYHQGTDDRGGDRWARTVERTNDYLAHGVRVVGVTPWTLYNQPRRFIDKLHRVVALGLDGPPPRVRVRPRSH